MIKSNYLKYIPDHKKDDSEMHKSLMIDVYYLYHGIKPNKNEKIISMNDMNKENLKLISLSE